MKKFLMIILSIICLFSFAMAIACDNNGGDGDQTNQPSNQTLMRGFNSWNELIMFDLSPTNFGGNWEVNRDPQYIVEGDGSWKIYLQTKKVNQPSFKMAATDIKTDITDVTEFNMWVYTDADYEFSVIITAFAGDTVVCAPMATVKQGANQLVFPINRALIAQTGKIITDYSISFSGIKSETTLYLDNFIAKTTTEEVKVKPEVQEVIDGIAKFGLSPERATVEAVMAKYNALSAEDRLCVSNAGMLKTAIEPFYLQDLAKAQKDRPDTLLYYDSQFGEVQVDYVTDGISGYSFSTEQKYGDQAGSLKVEFTTSSTYWVTLKTTATTLIEEEFIEFYVYNDSDQPKAMCVGWNAPENDLLHQPLYIIESRVWTKILCQSTWLTDAGGASGGIQMCGLVSIDPASPDLGSSEAPKGAMYFSAFAKKDDRMEIKAARTGEDANTLFFFDRELGLKQIACKKGEIALSETVTYEGQPTTAITIDNADSNPGPTFNNLYYDFKDGDVVAFYVKADIDADYLRLRMAYNNGTWIHKNVWTLVLFPASEVTKAWTTMECYNDGGDYKANKGANVNGTIYFAKAKVYSATEALDLTNVATDFEYNIGQTTFVGKAYEFKKGDYCYDPNVFNSPWYNKTYLVDDQVTYIAKSSNSDNATGAKRDTLIGFELKDAIVLSGEKMYILATGLKAPGAQAMSARESGHFGTPYATAVSTDADGFTLWEFDFTSAYVGKSLKYFRLFAGQQLIIPDIEQIVIKDIYFA